MNEYYLRIHKNNRLVLPKAVMEKYGMRPGDFVKMIALDSDSTPSPIKIEIIPMKWVPK